MHIKIYNRGTRNQLICDRHDGSVEIADIGPLLPHHDIAHYIVERQLQLKQGFYGNIYRGLTVAQLSDKEVIRTLPQEAMVSEVVTRALQSLGGGACRLDQFQDLIGLELGQMGWVLERPLEKAEIEQMMAEYLGLLEEWDRLREGEALVLELSVEAW